MSTLTLPARSGAEPLPDFPSLGADVVAAVGLPLGDLPVATRHALALAAAEPSGDLRVLVAAGAVLGVRLTTLRNRLRGAWAGRGGGRR
ncbi:MAG: hypothetical protein H6514_15665 [Acidimicrobiaceae bacterium]|nr:hypothetical protein [Acidimicrobiaceae bacterium]